MPPTPYQQHVPRPEQMTRRDGAPWARLPEEVRRHVPLDVVARAFPSVDARGVTTGPARAAVLAGVIELADEAHILLTRRSLNLVRDPGLISFPGGYIEDGEHPLDAALREAHEEIGLEPGFVEVRDCLGIVEKSRPGTRIVSYIGLVSPLASFTPSSDEVDELLMVPLGDLLSDGASWQEEWGSGEAMRVVHFLTSPMAMADNLVWGVTAKILWDLLVGVTDVLAQ